MSFNEKVWNLCKKIPRGKVTTYKIIAEQLGTKAYRAVGTALKKNKEPITIPCHRVVNSCESVGSYKGKRNSKEKIRLLRKEGIEIENNKIDLKKYRYRF